MGTVIHDSMSSSKLPEAFAPRKSCTMQTSVSVYTSGGNRFKFAGESMESSFYISLTVYLPC